MKYKNLHRWDVTPKQAIGIQRALAKNITRPGRKLDKIEKIAGIDVSFRQAKSCAAVCVFTYPGLALLEQKTAIIKTTFPYVPGLLTFREGPAVLNCLKKIKNKPDVILFDGQGIAHPRKMGLAAHLGLWLKLPTIGCAKTPLYGEFKMPAFKKGSYSFIKGPDSLLGVVLRTKDNIKPIFVSQGYRITLEDAIKISLNSCTKYRLPEPLRAAHTLSKTTLKKYLSA
jgi:deoxyribonuclease V